MKVINLVIAAALALPGNINVSDQISGDDSNKNASYAENANESANGFVETEGKKQYFENGIALKDKIVELEDSFFYVDEFGFVKTEWIQIERELDEKETITDIYYADEDGMFVKGWKEVDGSTYYFDIQDYRMLTGEHTIDDVLYSFDEAGKLMDTNFEEVQTTQIQNGFETVGNDLYYYSNGTLVKEQWVYVSGYYYYPGADGKIIKGLIEITSNGKSLKYISNDKGQMVYGWYSKNGRTYYTDTIYGGMKTGWVTISGNKYYFDLNDGHMYTGKHIIDGKEYYFDMSGIISSGLFEVGSDVYFIENGSPVKNKWVYEKGYYYYPGTDGKILKGMFEITSNGKKTKYISNDKGQMVYGWYSKDGKKYYTDAVYGGMKTGWVTISGKKYYFDSNDGHMYTGKQTIDGKVYYFDNNGIASSGVLEVGSDLYYIENGSPAKNKWVYEKGYYYYPGADGKIIKGLIEITSNGKNLKYISNDKGQMVYGWYSKNGRTYYTDTVYGGMKTGWVTINGKKYYFDLNDGHMYTGKHIIDGKEYYFDMSGIISSGLFEVGSDVYFIENGSPAKNKWVYEQGYYYYPGTDGKILKGMFEITSNGKKTKYISNDKGQMVYGWYSKDGKKYYTDAVYGGMKTGWVTISGKKYYFDLNDGHMYTGKQTIDGKDVYFTNTGEVTANGFVTIGSDLYYIENGSPAKSKWIYEKGYYYYPGADGKIIKGLIEITSNGKKTKYISNDKGQMVYGWYSKNSQYFYLDPIYGSLQTGWKTINGSKYYFDINDGHMYTGTQTIDGVEYTFSKTGELSNGWLRIGNDYYYSENGKLFINKWGYINNQYYYFQDDGKMATGWLSLTINGKGVYYYFEANGVAVKGSKLINGHYYLFNEYYAMETGKVNYKGSTYLLNANGTAYTGWKQESYWYYYDVTGKMAIDWVRINGSKNFFNARGEWIPGFNKKIIDVSDHQGVIDWDTVYRDGDIDGVILRCGYGYRDGQEDAQFKRNVQELNRLGIPYGVYLYSYAEYGYEGTYEANQVHKILSKYDVNLSYPIYYDIERFEIGGVSYDVPTSEYEVMIPNFVNRLKQLGYGNVKVYSYTSYLNTKLNSAKILPYVDWVAQYNYNCTYTGSSYNGWQYSSSETIPGISGRVDVNAWK